MDIDSIRGRIKSMVNDDLWDSVDCLNTRILFGHNTYFLWKVGLDEIYYIQNYIKGLLNISTINKINKNQSNILIDN